MKVSFIAWFSATLLVGIVKGDNRLYAESHPLPIFRLSIQSKSARYINPGYPVDNPPKRVVLPNGDNSVPLGDRYGELDQNGPVWANHDEGATPPSSQRNSARIKPVSNSIAPAPSKSPKMPAPNPKNIPNSCVWAIISCCSAASNSVNYNCFEQLGCAGSFWGGSPCEGEFAQAAISNAMSYYQAV